MKRRRRDRDSLVAHSRPPCASIIERQIASPMPMPAAWSYKRPRTDAQGSSDPVPDPNPVQLPPHPSSHLPRRKSTTLADRGDWVIASIAFIIRLSITCCNWIRSAKTSGTSSESCVSNAIMISLHFALRQRDHFTYDLIDVEPILLRRSLFNQGANSGDDFARSMSVIHHKGNRIPRFFQVFCIEPAQTGAGIVDECAERLVDFMGNGRS